MKRTLQILFSSLIIFSLMNVQETYADTCTSAGSGSWTDTNTWSCQTEVDSPPTGAWLNGEYLIIESGYTVHIPNNIIIDLTTSNIKELRIRGTLEFRANSKLILPSGAQIVLEEGAQINASNNSDGSLIEIGGNGVWGRACENDGCTNGTLTGPGTIDEYSDPNSPLPIKLVSFTSTVDQDHVMLNWETSMEKDFDHFKVERSADANEFETIGWVVGDGQNSFTPKFYSFIDLNPIQGKAYYRLKAIDINGSSETFEAIKVIFNYTNNSINLYPNPLNGTHFSFNANFNIEEEANISILDMQGKVVHTQAVKPGETYTLKNPLQKGIYLLIYQDSHQSLKNKIIVD